MQNRRSFGLIPAAGLSRRMGTHKLLMPWGGATVIDSVLAAWTSSSMDQIVVVARQNDAVLIEKCHAWSVDVVKLVAETADMKASIQCGLEFIESQWTPNETDICLIAPADLPRISAELIDEVAGAIDGEEIVTPVYGTKNGHPLGFPWSGTGGIFELAADEGLDSLLRRSATKNVEFDISLRPRDIDTPTDYERELNSDS